MLSESNLDAGGGAGSRKIAAWAEADYVTRGHEETVRGARADGNGTWAASLSLWTPLAAHRAATCLVVGETPSWREQLYALTIPPTMIFGEKTLPHPDFDRLPGNGVKVSVVANAGHSMAWENPSGVAAAIAQALA
ncbi:hypothetical protein [Terrarubrum flagellatum]|uniref:hypothetical protein n=1 Tax=Terrirubrum flagellatum TaxID=2895980 RepID=UPI003144E2B4